MQENNNLLFDATNEFLKKANDEHWTERYDKIKKNEKRFERYVSRLSEMVYSVLTNSFPEFCFPNPNKRYHFNRPEDKKSWGIHTTNLETFCSKYLLMCVSGNLDGMKEMGVAVNSFLKTFYTPFKLDEESQNSLFDFLNGKSFFYKGKELKYKEMFNCELLAASESFLEQLTMCNDDLNVDNYLRVVPQILSTHPVKQSMTQEVLSYLLSRLLFNISIFLSSSSSLQKALEEEEIKKIKEERDELKKELKKKERELSEKERESKEKEEKISVLTSKLLKKEKEKEKEQDASAEIENLSYEKKSLLRQNRKLQGYYSDLLSKYEKLKEKMREEGEDVEEEKVEEMKEVDLNARYLFFMGNDIGCRVQIKEMFPNAEFTCKAINFSLTSYDMVVVLTGCVEHKYYYKIKEQCKIHGVPIAHCPHSNLEMIKTMIWNVLN